MVIKSLKQCTTILAGVIVAMPIASSVGCTYARTTPLKRLAGDEYAASSNGDTRRRGQVRPFRGMPVVLEVPTHYAVTVTETTFVYREKDNTIHEVVFRNPGTPRLLDVGVDVVRRKKLFSVDFARPAGGTLTSAVTFNDVEAPSASNPEGLTAGHIKEINNTVNEQTINQITEALSESGVRKLFGRAFSGGTSEHVEAPRPHTIKVEKTVAYRLFDVDAPGVADQISAFLEHHVSACHGCEGAMPCGETGSYEEIPIDSSSMASASGVTQVSFDDYAPDKSEACDSPDDERAAGVGLRATLREKESPYLTTTGFTLYEVEVVYE